MDRLEQGYSRLERKKLKKEIERSKRIALAKVMTAIFTCTLVVGGGLWFGMRYVSGSVLAASEQEASTKADAAGKHFGWLLSAENRGDQPEDNERYGLNFDNLFTPYMQNAGTLPACRVVVNVPSRTLDFYNKNSFIKTYPLAIGKPSTPTPLGQFIILQKEINPLWYPPKGKTVVPSGPNNPLGYRWMGFAPMYGIHGTNTPWEIGGWVSNGCVRMREEDVEELYELVPNGTAVYINYDLVRVEVDFAGQVSLGIYPDAYKLKDQVTVSEVQSKLAEKGVPNFVSPASLQRIIDQRAGKQVALLHTHKVKVNGNLLSGQAVVSEGHIFVPVWAVAIALKTNVVWDEKSQRIYAGTHAVPGIIRDQVLYAAAEDIQSLFGGLWIWQPNDNAWELATMNMGRRL